MRRATAAIVGAGIAGTDLMMKLRSCDEIELLYVVDAHPAAPGLRTARALGIEAVSTGPTWLLSRSNPPDVVFDATTAKGHASVAFKYAEAGIAAVDLTPAMLGPAVSPVVNLDEHRAEPNLSIGSCVGQAAAPIVRAIAEIVPVAYAEVRATIPAESAGPATRSSVIDFAEATSRTLREVGHAQSASTVVVLDEANAGTMRVTLACAIPFEADAPAVMEAVGTMPARMQAWIPGFRLRREVRVRRTAQWPGCSRVTVALEVTAEGESPATYAGNLAILSASATRAGEALIRARACAVS